ncbi:MAG: hypothetical protein IIB94_11665, partial [Candidatus Marinimicrobia bacterium]|nr:hypothetical protein [Candidatus Neomarinimicrobiota bacterium]
KYNLWFSQEQKDDFSGEKPTFGKLEVDGTIVEYTEMRRVEDDHTDRDDAVCLGVGKFDHREE